MSFWQTSDNEDATANGTTYDSGGGSFENIPNNTDCTAMPDEAKWATKDNAEYISVRWRVAKPDIYANRTIFTKLFVTDDDPNVRDATKMDRKRDKAKRMLAAIDANAGGKLSKLTSKPTDVQLASALLGKAMNIKVMVWEMDDREKPGEKISGNWVAAISAKGPVADAKPAPKTNPATRAPSNSDDDFGDVPF